MDDFTPNGTMGRLQIMPGTCERPRMLTKPPGICEEWLKKTKEEYDNKSWWDKLVAVGFKSDKEEPDEITNAKYFKKNCEMLPQEIPETYIDDLRQQLTNYIDGKSSWVSPEYALELRGTLSLLESIYYPGPKLKASYSLTEAEEEWIARNKNNFDFALLGVFSLPGRGARAAGVSEKHVNEVNETIGLGAFNALTAHMAVMELRAFGSINRLSRPPIPETRIEGGGAKVAYRMRLLPQGVALNEFNNLSNTLRILLREKGIPDGKIYIHGSRANGTAKSGESDIDIMVIISDAEFAAFTAKRIELSSEKMKLKLERMIRNQQRLNGRALGQGVESGIWENVYPALSFEEVSKVQVSVMKESSPFNKGPYIEVP